MTGPLHVTPDELRDLAGRIDGYGVEVGEIAPEVPLTAAAADLGASRVAAITRALASRLGESTYRLSSDLSGAADRLRNATDAIVDSDAHNATMFGGR
ncbi:hypothetical protein NGF75_13275 [Dietzia kunjamensis]|uniref:hypothetical protein n=1 Tax=Dietzia kunjamensis TaxID=322509 RepID=UPI002DBC63B8|nr:hypothetical protein [Dietzia kunjamensis]MEB8326943.1 hypothetical protein [Dietzia kunjamensis]